LKTIGSGPLLRNGRNGDRADAGDARRQPAD
jgi:hypothetical protein